MKKQLLTLGTSMAMVALSATPALALLPNDHRGEHTKHQEDTVSSIDAAYALNHKSNAESDVWWAADGVPVIMHDPTLVRTTNCTGKVIDYTSTYLKTHCAVDAIKSIPTQPIPTLQEELTAIHANTGQGAVFDLRGDWTTARVKALDQMLASDGMTSRTWVMTPADAMLTHIKSTAPDIQTVWRKKCRPTCDVTPSQATTLGVSAVMWGSTADYSKVKVQGMHAVGIQVWQGIQDGSWATMSSWGTDRVMTNNPTLFGPSAR